MTESIFLGELTL